MQQEGAVKTPTIAGTCYAPDAMPFRLATPRIGDCLQARCTSSAVQVDSSLEKSTGLGIDDVDWPGRV